MACWNEYLPWMHRWIYFLNTSRVYFWCKQLWHSCRSSEETHFNSTLSTFGMFQSFSEEKLRKSHTHLFQPFIAFKANFKLLLIEGFSYIRELLSSQPSVQVVKTLVNISSNQFLSINLYLVIDTYDCRYEFHWLEMTGNFRLVSTLGRKSIWAALYSEVEAELLKRKCLTWPDICRWVKSITGQICQWCICILFVFVFVFVFVLIIDGPKWLI